MRTNVDSWIFAKWANRLFGICSLITVVVILTDVVTLCLPTIEDIQFSQTRITIALFSLFVAVIGVCIASQVGLWIGMLVFSAKYDGRPVGWRIGGVLFQVVGLSLASSLVYLLA